MLANRRNTFLFAKATETPVGSGPAKIKAPSGAGKTESDETSDEEEEDEEEDPDDVEDEEEEEDPDAPESAAPVKLSIFQRGTLMTKPKADLVGQIAQLRGTVQAQTGTIKKMQAQIAGYKSLEAENSQLRKDLKASKSFKGTISNGVRKELAALGIDADQAPAPKGEEKDKTISRAEFDKLDHSERNARMSSGWKITA